MSAPKKPLLPTLTLAVGMLLGGLVGAGIGLLFQQESAVITGYIAGDILGALLGIYGGWKWHRRMQPNSGTFLATYWPARRKDYRPCKADSDSGVTNIE